MCCFGRRYYDPEIGRFINTDPEDQYWDSYNYCGGDPVNNIDPDGADAGDALVQSFIQETQSNLDQAAYSNYINQYIQLMGQPTLTNLSSDGVGIISAAVEPPPVLPPLITNTGVSFSTSQLNLSAAGSSGSIVASSSEGLASVPLTLIDPRSIIEGAEANPIFCPFPIIGFGGIGASKSAVPLAEDFFQAAKNGLGILAGREISVTQKGLTLVENHLTQFGSVPENTAMIGRLQTALQNGAKISGADASFYFHEASEATMMGRGMTYEAAHAASLSKYGVSPFSVYHPEVIQALPESFNSNWFNFWGLK